jgi:hypothetical protein
METRWRLAPGEFHAALTDFGVVALRQVGDELVGLRGLRGLHDLSAVRIEASVGDVVGHGPVEQEGVLTHVPHGVPEAVEGHVAHVPAVDPDRAVGHVVEPDEELEDGGLARARGADESDGLARLRGEVHVLQHRFVLVGEVHAVVLDFAPHAVEFLGVGVVRDGRLHRHQREDAARGGLRVLVAVHDLAHLGQGLDHALDQQEERDERPDREVAREKERRLAQQPEPAHDERRDERDGGQQLHPRPVDEVEPEHFQSRRKYS